MRYTTLCCVFVSVIATVKIKQNDPEHYFCCQALFLLPFNFISAQSSIALYLWQNNTDRGSRRCGPSISVEHVVVTGDWCLTETVTPHRVHRGAPTLWSCYTRCWHRGGVTPSTLCRWLWWYVALNGRCGCGDHVLY